MIGSRDLHYDNNGSGKINGFSIHNLAIELIIHLIVYSAFVMELDGILW